MNEYDEERYCICGDCGAIVAFTHELHNEEKLCSCGGQMCGCDFCNEKYASHLNPILINKI
ncbi:hypothetical protein [Thaumasiovibrio subtropicus]|uniref:hypothetical protein n=1 Tax=Thaumasiovibrio subtropicus TaxID=1891207 RepID=UPI000B3621A2|nr:hypothetical protein [Thaumasiovibrio subtropicus]